MKNTKIKFEFCDFCEVAPDNAKDKVADKQCAVCGKWSCPDKNCKARPDDYRTTAHLPNQNYGEKVWKDFVCKDCWAIATTVESGLISKGIYIGASGSCWAIKLGEYGRKIYNDAVDKTSKEITKEIIRLVVIGKKQNVEKLKQAKLREKADKMKSQCSVYEDKVINRLRVDKRSLITDNENILWRRVEQEELQRYLDEHR
jgi:hypothetical protein